MLSIYVTNISLKALHTSPRNVLKILELVRNNYTNHLSLTNLTF